MSEWWLSSDRMTIAVTVDDGGIIRSAAPIARRFVGQHARNLATWMRRQGGFKSKRLA